MLKKILLTSFQTWLPHHISNSSDDLLSEIETQDFPNASLHFCRKLPVDNLKSTEIVMDKIVKIKPDIVICCGMAENRDCLTVESHAISEEKKIYTNVNLENLILNTSFTQISNDAGKFVCENLYYHVLQEIKQNKLKTKMIFIHVPILNSLNKPQIIQDFKTIILNLIRLTNNEEIVNNN